MVYKNQTGQILEHIVFLANKVDMIYIDNAVHAHLKACEALEQDSHVAGKCYFVSDAEPVVLWEWINRLLKEMNIPIVKRKISYGSAYAIGTGLEWIYKLLGIEEEPPMTRFLAVQLATSHYFNNSNARKDLDYYPLIEQEKAFQNLIIYLKNESVN